MAKHYEVCAHLLIISTVIEDEMSIYSDGFRDGVAFFIKTEPKSAVSLASEFSVCPADLTSMSITCSVSFTFLIFLSSYSYLFIRVQRESMGRRS